ncbi:gamma-glutamylcyclotransferase family protein [Streptomyces sp. NPDC001858]
MSAPELPFFVYGTLRPGEVNHDLFLRGRTLREEPARLAGAVLYDGPGYPYAVEEPRERGAAVAGELVTARPEAYARLLADLDRLEEYAPGDPHNLYERVEREVVCEVVCGVADGEASPPGGPTHSVRAWVYVAAPAVAAALRARGKLIKGGDWLTRR